MKKFLKIKDYNKFIYFKNRKVRTPVVLQVTNDDIKKLDVILRMADIQEFEIILENELEKEEQNDIIIEENKNIIIEELDIKEEPSTILEELMRNGEKPWNE